MVRQEHSFGVIPLKFENEKAYVLLVKHGKGHWGFPKGHANQGETAQQTASRELQEETGVIIERWLSTPPVLESYVFSKEEERILKVVTYFLAEVSGNAIAQPGEIEEVKWMPLGEAAQTATFPATKAICQQVEKILK